MDKAIRLHIIELTKEHVRKSGHYSIRQAARDLGHTTVSLSEQKELAKLIVKSEPFITEIKNGDIIVRENRNVEASAFSTEDNYKVLKFIVGAVVALLAYLVFQVLLPGLKT